jgi:hypothetical protein
MPDLNMSGECQRCQAKGLQRHNGLKGDHGPAFIPAFDQNARRQRQEQGRKGAGKADDTQVQWAARDAIRQVWLGCVLHPGADHRDELPDQEQDKIPRGQRGKTLAQAQTESIDHSVQIGTSSSGLSFSVLLTSVATG